MRLRILQFAVFVVKRAHRREPEDDVGERRVLVRDDDVVHDVVPELVEVRPAVRFLQGDVVGDQRHSVRAVRSDECVDVRAVRHGVLADLRRFAVRGHLSDLPPR